jgi:uncharacterized membrane protein YbhN (UPF0104 family)
VTPTPSLNNDEDDTVTESESEQPAAAESADRSRRRWIRFGKILLQIAILALVVWGMWGTVADAFRQLDAKGVSPWKADYRWLTLAGVFYLLGMLPCALFWSRVMTALGQHVPMWPAMSAYFISQLGKYVPGKFMVVVVRTALAGRYRVNKTLTVASIFVETLTMMSVGAMLGAVTLAMSVASDWRLMAFAVLAAAGVGAPTLPPVFLRVVKWTRLHRLHPEIDQSLAGLNWHILWPGWIAIALGWVAMGFSLWAVLNALPGAPVSVHLPGDLPILIACMALSTVAGFVSGLPGGLGAREWVVIQLLEPHLGPTAAVLSAIVHRLVMMAAEIILSGVIFALTRKTPTPPVG